MMRVRMTCLTLAVSLGIYQAVAAQSFSGESLCAPNAKWAAASAAGLNSPMVKILPSGETVVRFPPVSANTWSMASCQLKTLPKAQKAILLRLKPGDGSSLGRRLVVSLDGANHFRAFASIVLDSSDWKNYKLDLNASSGTSSLDPLSPEIDEASMKLINCVSFITDSHGTPSAPAMSIMVGGVFTACDSLPASTKSQRDVGESPAPTLPDISKLPLQLPVRTDAHTRPEFKDGNIFVNGKPGFIMSVNLGNRHMYYWNGLSEEKKKTVYGDSPYQGPLTKELCGKAGLDSIELTNVPTKLQYDNPFLPPDLQLQFRNLLGWYLKPGGDLNLQSAVLDSCAEELKGLEGLPLSLDFCGPFYEGNELKQLLACTTLPESIFSKTGNTFAGGAAPWSTEDPVGKLLYHAYYQNAAYWLLSNKLNPWLYELFNELQRWNPTAPSTRKAFTVWAQARYGSIDVANAKWKSDLKSFAALEEMPSGYKGNRRLYCDWMKFMGDRWQEVIREGKEAVRRVDARPNTYFTWEISNAGVFYDYLAADYYKGAKAVDAFSYEGGASFGELPGAVNDPTSLEAVVVGFGTFHQHFILDLCRSLALDKPMINQEAYVRRNSALGQLPTKRSDFVTTLWTETIHGASSVSVYSWEVRPQISREKTGVGWLDHLLLNPAIFGGDTLEGIKDFKKEIDRLGDIVLPKPRIKGVVALLHSQPTIWRSASFYAWKGQKLNTKEKELSCYNALLFSHYPSDILYEEALNEGKGKQYEAIVIPWSQYVYKDTFENLKAYVANGGTLVLLGGAMAYDEYGDPLDAAALLGCERVESPFKPAATAKLSASALGVGAVPLDCVYELKELGKDAKILGEIADGAERRPGIVKRTFGKGKVYVAAMENIPDQPLMKMLSGIFADAGVTKPFSVENAEKGSGPLGCVEAQLIDRGDKKIFFLVNWENLHSKMVKLRPNGLSGNWQACDLVTSRPLAAPSGGTEWTAEDLNNGISVVLPAQERVLIMLSRTPYPEAKGTPTTSLDQQTFLGRLRDAEVKERAKLNSAVKAMQLSGKSHGPARAVPGKYEGIDPKGCFPIDISTQTNMGFADDVEEDGKGGWTDQGQENDLGNIPVGLSNLAGVPFKVINPKENDARSCIMLRSKLRPSFPEAVKGIVVEAPLKRLYFLHGAGWCMNGELFKYVVNYADGGRLEIPVRGGLEISDWFSPKQIPNAKIGWVGNNRMSPAIGVYVMEWLNPSPEKPVKSIDIISSETEAIPGVIAISGMK